MQKSKGFIEAEKRIADYDENKNTLNLSDLNLTSKELEILCESLIHLEDLNNIELNNNNIITIPESLTRLIDLEELKLFNNKITTIPESLSRLKNLQYLDFDDNNIKNLPEYVFLNLPNLENAAKDIDAHDYNSGLDLDHNPLPQNYLEILKTYKQPIATLKLYDEFRRVAAEKLQGKKPTPPPKPKVAVADFKVMDGVIHLDSTPHVSVNREMAQVFCNESLSLAKTIMADFNKSDAADKKLKAHLQDLIHDLEKGIDATSPALWRFRTEMIKAFMQSYVQMGAGESPLSVEAVAEMRGLVACMTSLQAQYHALRDTLAEEIAQSLTETSSNETEAHLDEFCSALKAVETDQTPTFTTPEVRDSFNDLQNTVKTNPEGQRKRALGEMVILAWNFTLESSKYYAPKIKQL